MDIKSIEDLVKQIVFILGGWTVIVTGLSALISQIVTRKLFITWDKKYQIEIDNLRHLQTESQLVLKELISSISNNQSLIQRRKIEAIDKLWNAIVKLRKDFGPSIFFFGMLRPGDKIDRSNPVMAAILQNNSMDQAINWSRKLMI